MTAFQADFSGHKLTRRPNVKAMGLIHPTKSRNTQNPREMSLKDTTRRRGTPGRLRSGRRGSNPRHSRWQRDALPLSYARDYLRMTLPATDDCGKAYDVDPEPVSGVDRSTPWGHVFEENVYPTVAVV